MGTRKRGQSVLNKSGSPAPARARRQKENRGLPDAQARIDLARTYLEIQNRLWPELVKAGRLCRPTNSNVQRLADEFERGFVNREAAPEGAPTIHLQLEVGGAYLRYSCDNSNPRSLDQQLRNALERARRENVFIPWAYVFADAAVTGTVANRRGYEMAKAAIEAEQTRMRWLFIDEIGRAARDAIEALTLGQLMENCGKRLIGVSDGFDSDLPHAKLMLAILAAMQEWYVDELRRKVERGMIDAFLQGRNIHPPSVGYKLVPAADKHGNPIYDPDGTPLRAKAIDHREAERVREAFQLFAEKHWSPERIARRFNELKVGGKQTWDRRRIMQLLKRDVYRGIEFYRRTFQVRDRRTGKVTVRHRPKEEWKRRDVPHLRIVSDELWDKAQVRRKQCSQAYAPAIAKRKRGNRTEAYPTTLIRPICGYCGNPLWLGRSGKYASFCCINGRDGKQGCKLRTYKSVRIVETAILDHLRKHVFTEDFLGRVLKEANRSLAEQARQPRRDTRPILRRINELAAKRDRLAKVLDRYGDDELDVVVKQLQRLEREIKEQRRVLNAAESNNALPPPAMKNSDVEGLLEDLHGLLSEDVSVVAPVLTQLAGPIHIRQGDRPEAKGTPWIATFQVNAVPVLAELAARRGCPTAGTWEYLNARGWTMGCEGQVELRHVPSYERIAAKVKDAIAEGASLNSLASAAKVNWSTVRSAREFAATGRRRKPKRKVKFAG